MPRIMIPLDRIERGYDEAYMFSVDPDEIAIECWCHYVSDFGNVIGKAPCFEGSLDAARKRAARLEQIMVARYAS